MTTPTIAPGLWRRRWKASRQSPPAVGSSSSSRASISATDTRYLPASRIRGLRSPYEMSTTRFTSTTMIATKRTPPWITG